MQMKAKVAVTVVVFTIVGFLFESAAPIGSLIWPQALGPVTPTGTQIGLLVIVGVIEAIAFGLGVAFVAFGWPMVKSAARTPANATLAFVAIAWSLLSWVPHDSLHQHIGDNFAALIGIEWGFHVTLIASAAILAKFFLDVLRGAQPMNTTGAAGARMGAPVRRE